MSRPRIAVIGCGYWGLNLIRNFSELSDVEIKAGCDLDLNALARVKRRYPTIDLRYTLSDVLADSHIDAVVIATPLATHYPFARQALLSGKHVLVEKPMATSSRQALELIDLADKQGKVLMVDHTFLYAGAVRCLKALAAAGELGDLLYYDAVRISLGLVQSDINVLWELGPHDFSIMNFLNEKDPVSIAAVGVKHMNSSFENIAYVSATYENNLIAHFHLNWLAPVKVRKLLVGGSKKLVVFDDMEASEKVKVYGSGLSMAQNREAREQLLTGFQSGDMLAPHLDTSEALRVMAKDFAGAIIQRRAPISDGASGYRVVRMLEAAQLSIERNGTPIDLRTPPTPQVTSRTLIVASA